MTQKPQSTQEELENMTTEAYHAMLNVLDMAKTEDMFNALKRGDEGTYEKIHKAASEAGLNYLFLPRTQEERFEYQRLVGTGMIAGIIDATRYGVKPPTVSLDKFKGLFDMTESSKMLNELSGTALTFGASGSKELVKDAMDYVRETHPLKR